MAPSAVIDERVVARVRRVVGRQQGRQGIEVVGRLGDDAARRGHIRGVQGREARVAPEDPEDADPLVAPKRRPLAVDGLLRARDRRREADAVLGPLDVVVHRLGDGHQWHAGADQDLRVRQRVIAPDRDQHVDAERFEIVEDARRQVVDPIVGREPSPLLLGHPLRHSGGRHPARVGPGGVQDRPTGALDGPGVDAIERPEVAGVGPVARPDMRQAFPPAADADGRVTGLRGAIDDTLDDGVETRDVASAGEDRDPFRFSHPGAHATAPAGTPLVAIRRRSGQFHEAAR